MQSTESAGSAGNCFNRHRCVVVVAIVFIAVDDLVNLHRLLLTGYSWDCASHQSTCNQTGGFFAGSCVLRDHN